MVGKAPVRLLGEHAATRCVADRVERVDGSHVQLG
jgi:hypothetical protein